MLKETSTWHSERMNQEITVARWGEVGTPVLITSHMPGQEDGNPRWVTAADAGELANTRAKLTEAVPRWLADTARQQTLRRRSS